MKKILTILIIILMAIPMVFAQGPSDNNKKVLGDAEGNTFMEFPKEKTLCQQFIENKDEIIGVQIPKYIPYKNEVFHAYYQDNTVMGSIELVDGKITDISCEIKGKPTFIVYVKNDETLLNLGNSENPLGAFNEAKKNKEIIIKGVTMTKKIKNGLTSLMTKVASWFM